MNARILPKRPTLQAARKKTVQSGWEVVWQRYAITIRGWLFWLKNLLLIGLLLSILATALQWLLDPQTLPIMTVQIEGHVRTSREALQTVIVPHIANGFFAVDTQTIRMAVLALPWVKDVQVQRFWHDTLFVSVQERQAIARWQPFRPTHETETPVKSQLIDTEGDLFTVTAQEQSTDLPIFSGSMDNIQTLLTRYLALQPLLQTAGLRIIKMTCNARQAWTMRLNNGMKLWLGRGDNRSRLRHFLKVYQHILNKRPLSLSTPITVDLRYTNGVAVQLATGSANSLRDEE